MKRACFRRETEGVHVVGVGAGGKKKPVRVNGVKSGAKRRGVHANRHDFGAKRRPFAWEGCFSEPKRRVFA
jgi:hypothetical protein